VVVPAYNEETELPQCLAALAAQQTKHSIEVLVVDNASTDSTSMVARSWSDRLAIRVISEPRRARGAARRTGFALTDTAIVLSTDADTIVPVDWVESLVDCLLLNPEAAAVTTSCYITDGTPVTNWTMRVGMPLSLRLYRAITGHYLLSGSTFAIRRLAYESAGGFDAGAYMLEDVDLSFRVADIGRIIYMPEPRVETEGDVFREGYLRGFWHYFRPYLQQYILGRRNRIRITLQGPVLQLGHDSRRS
jgi:poly-beta-1,6-N-acetyl-D-glucosamine synthase